MSTMAVAAEAPSEGANRWFGPEPTLVTLAAGAEQVFDSDLRHCWTIELRPSWRFHHVGPWLLAGTGRDGEFYAVAGILSDIRLGDRWVLTPSFGGGYYNDSGGLDLGLDMQFRSAIEIARRFGGGYRMGVCLAHLSNGSLGEENPGTETLAITFSIPLGRAR